MHAIHAACASFSCRSCSSACCSHRPRSSSDALGGRGADHCAPLVVIVLEDKEYASICAHVGALPRPTVHPSGPLLHQLPRRRTSIAAELPGHDLREGQRLPRRSSAPLIPIQQPSPWLRRPASTGAPGSGSMPSRCALRSSGTYAVSTTPPPTTRPVPAHVPWARRAVPVDVIGARTVHVHHPNICDDMHDCSVIT